MPNRNKSDDRKYEYDIKYLKKVFSDIDEGIIIPESISANSLRGRLNGIDAPAIKPGIAASAVVFLRSKVFSFQSVVSYALAFAIIFAVTYMTRLNTPSIVDGTIMPESRSQSADRSAQSTAAVFDVADIFEEGENDSPLYSEEQAEAPSAQDALSDIYALGVGGGGETKTLLSDDKFSYLCRYNDITDPDRSSCHITLEILRQSDGRVVTSIDVADITEILDFYVYESSIGFVGTDGEKIYAAAYSTEGIDLGEQAELKASFADIGRYDSSHEVDGILRVVTISDSETPEDITAERLPDSTSDTVCIVTAVDLISFKTGRSAFVGADADKDISLHNKNIYISYDVESKEENKEPLLYMVQVKLDGTDVEMLLVP